MEKIEKKIKDILDKQCCWCGGVSHKDRELTPGQTRTAILRLIEKAIGNAHMAGQADAGVDPGYSNAQAYCNEIMEEKS